MKTLFITIISMIIGSLLTLWTIQWQDEDLQYFLSAPSVFGDIVYQNLLVKNTGWNPAEDVIILLNRKTPPKNSVKETPSFNIQVVGEYALGGYERIRRNEVVTISFAHTKGPLIDKDLIIKSKRSIAKPAVGSTFENPILYQANKVLSWLALVLMIALLFLKFYEKKIDK